MSRRENKSRASSAKWPSLPGQEDTFDDLDNSFTLEANMLMPPHPGHRAIIDGSGRIVAFKAGTIDSRSSDSEEGNKIIVGLRHASSPAGAFGERDWSRPTRKRIHGQPAAGSDLDWPSAHQYQRSQDHDHDHGRLPRTRAKPSRRPAGEARPILGRGQPRRGMSVPPHGQSPAETGRGRGRYASSGTQTMPGAQPVRAPDPPKGLDSGQPGIQTPVPVSSPTQGRSTSVPGAEGGSKPSPETSHKPSTPMEDELIKQPAIVPESQLSPSVQPTPSPQPVLPSAQLSPGPQVPVVLDPKADVTATTVTAPIGSSVSPIPDIPLSSGDSTIPTVPAQILPPLASLYMLTAVGQESQVQDPLSGSLPKDHVVYIKEDGESHEFLDKSGPMLFEAVLNPTAAGDQVLELAINDKLREYFTFAWKQNEAKMQDMTSFLQGFAVTVQSQADQSFEITNLKMEVSTDSNTPALVFSTSADVLNQEFEVGYTSPAPVLTDVVAAVSTEASQITTLSGIQRYPGNLVFGLEDGTADGGFKTLADFCALACLSPKPWLKALLNATTITFGSLTGTTARNAIWYLPGSFLHCCIRLEASVDLDSKIVKQLDKYIAGWKDELPHISAIVRRSAVPVSDEWEDAFVEGKLVIAVEPRSVDGVPHGLGAYFSFADDEITLMLVCYSEKLQWSFLKKWLLESCAEVGNAIHKLEDTLFSLGKSSSSSTNSSNQSQAGSIDHILWRKVTAVIRSGPTASDTTLVSLILELEANFQILVPDGKSAVFSMVFAWDKVSGEFSGHCAFNGVGPLLDAGEPPLQYRWNYERWNTLSYLVPSEPYMSLRYLSTTISEHLPFGVPTEIVFADLFVSNKRMSFRGELQALLGQQLTAPSSSSFLDISYAIMNIEVEVDFSESPKKIDASVDGAVYLVPYRQGSPSATLQASISYGSENNLLSFHASAACLPMTVLHTFFHEGEEREHAMSILEHIILQQIVLSVNHSQGSDIAMHLDAAIEISEILLTTKFDRPGAGDWSFSAELVGQQAGSSPKDIDLGEAIRKLLGPTVAELIPDFVTKTKLKQKDPGNDKFDVICLRVSNPEYLVFGAELKFGMLHVQFAQIAPIADKTNTGAKASVKRLIRVSVGPLPSVPQLPVVGELDIPFDALEFLWASATVTKDEVDVLNGKVGIFQKQAIAMCEGDLEIAQGFHFRLVGGGSVFLDHVFDNGTKPQSTDKASPPTGKEVTGDAASGSQLPVQDSGSSKELTLASSSGSSAATTAALDKKKGPLTLSGVALSYEGGKLRIHLDASVLIGPIGAGVQGLNLIMDVSKVDGLHNLLHVPMEVQIEGFDMSFDRSPVMLAGALYHKPDTKAYYGGIAISLSKLSIAALGMYSQIDAVANPPTPAYDSFFVYAMLEGLIFTVGWAEIRGLIAGFGYNSRLRLPSVDQITSFPLMQGFSTPGGFNMDDAIKSLTGPDSFMTPSRGSLWMALGLVIRACEAIDMKAVATVALGPDQTEIGLIARATATLPRGSSAESALILIDLSVIGKLDLVHGELSVDGLINPTSFILNKDCRPSGGFSIRTWFGDSPHEGDWVVSFGGYHPLYQVPSHYPTPPRLGISWNLGDNLRVTGNAYAAVTPGAVMAGGLLQAVFSAGSFGAHFDAHADFLVNLKPLYYQADMAVFAGVYYEIRVWLVRKKISVDIGASLHLEGPPIHGEVRFDLCVVSFSVSFGSGSSEGARAIKLSELMDLVLQKSGKDKIGNTINNAHTFTVVSGLLGEATTKDAPQKEETQKEPWVVRSDNFLFQVRSAVPVSNAVVDLNNGSGSSYSGKKIISRPMRMTDKHSGINSSLNVQVRRVGSTELLPFKAVARIEDKLPANYWGRYSENPGDYMRPDPATMPSSINHLVGMTIVPPLSKRSENSVTVFKSVADPFETEPWRPASISKKATRFVDDNDARDSVKWSRVRGAMSAKARGKQTKLRREDIMKSFIAVAHPSKDAQTKKVKDAYQRIGASVPSVVLNDPARFYISPPTVFCN